MIAHGSLERGQGIVALVGREQEEDALRLVLAIALLGKQSLQELFTVLAELVELLSNPLQLNLLVPRWSM
jgi:hypothetical protein